MSWVGALLLACGPLAAQTASSSAPTPSLTQSCSSAKAVHDMRCPNYTGFKPRLGGPSGAALPDALDPATLGRTLQRGLASWYGPRFHGQRTASGEPYDMHGLTAAHRSLPFGTRVLVQNPRTGKQVVVRINDRGPFAAGRVIDLSRAAAQALGMLQRGHDTVVLREVADDEADALLVSADDSVSLR